MQLRRIVASAVAIGTAAFIATGCGNGIPKDSICGVYGDGIATSEYTKILDQAKRNYDANKQPFPKKGSEDYKTLTKQAVDYLITQKLYEREAKRAGIDVSKKKIDERLKQVKDSFFKGDEKKYKAELKKQNLTEADLRKNLKMQIINEKLYNRNTKEVKVSDAKAEAYYKENTTQFKTQESRDVAHILVKDKKEADKLYAQIKSGDDKSHKLFAKLAKKYSKDPGSAAQGGTLAVTRGQTVPEFDKKSFELKVGETSAPVKTQYGYHIIQARSAVKPAKQQSFKDVKAQIKQQLEQEQKTKRMQDWQDNVRKRAADGNVKCRKGYVWTQTVKSTETAPTPPAPAPDTKDKKADVKKAATDSTKKKAEDKGDK